MTTTDDQTLRQRAADLVRDWADRRMLASNDPNAMAGGPHGAKERIVIGKDTRDLFEDCADDIERGLP